MKHMSDSVNDSTTPGHTRPIATLSIAIPTHRWHIGELVRRLANEVLEHGLSQRVQLCVFDDAAAAQLASNNAHVIREAASRGLLAVLQRSDVNVGRSAARNALMVMSTGTHLLFLDDDVLPDRPTFVRDYLELADKGASAVCGGISYQQCPPPSARHAFYLRYSSSASVAPAQTRMLQPWAWVYTANVMVARSTILKVPFEEAFVGYGYEDLEWGLRLQGNGHLQHVDNSVTHMGLLTREELADKTAQAANNLVYLCRLHPSQAESLPLFRMARLLGCFPPSLLTTTARLSHRMFLSAPGPHSLLLFAFQATKLCLSALAVKAAGRRRETSDAPTA
jgi:GT2 family glycosyltransferase